MYATFILWTLSFAYLFCGLLNLDSNTRVLSINYAVQNATTCQTSNTQNCVPDAAGPVVLDRDQDRDHDQGRDGDCDRGRPHRTMRRTRDRDRVSGDWEGKSDAFLLLLFVYFRNILL